MNATGAIELRAVTKRYGAAAVVDRVSFTVEAGYARHPARALGLREDHHAPADRRPRDAERGPHPHRRPRRHRLGAGRAQRQPGLPVLRAVPAPDRDRQRGLRPAGARRRGPRQPTRRAREALALLGLTGLEARLPAQLSGGQQQRVALARALVLEPGALLFDEPLSNLDARLRRRVRDEIRALQRRLGLSVVYVTHDREEALAVSDRIIVMDRGRIVEQGPPAELFASPRTRFVADFLAEANIVGRPASSPWPASWATWRSPATSSACLAGDMPWGEVTVAIRPDAIRVGRPGASGGDRRPCPPRRLRRPRRGIRDRDHVRRAPRDRARRRYRVVGRPGGERDPRRTRGGPRRVARAPGQSGPRGVRIGQRRKDRRPARAPSCREAPDRRRPGRPRRGRSRGAPAARPTPRGRALSASRAPRDARRC